MDHDISWWVHVLFDGWRDRTGPRYLRLAASVLEAVDRRTLREGTRLPAERLLAAGLGVSRGTVVACFDHLAEAGVVRRRQGSGTFVVGRPGWARPESDSSIAALLFRRLAGGRDAVDLSLSSPAGVDHLPAVDSGGLLTRIDGHGLDPRGLPELRDRIAEHLTARQGLPTRPDQLIVTGGAQQALSLVAMALLTRSAAVVTPCPTYPGVASAFSGRPHKLVGVPAGDSAGVDPDALIRAARRVERAVVYLAPTGHNPTGSVMPRHRREAILAGLRAAGAVVVEDLTLADLVLDAAAAPTPLAALDEEVIAVGSASKLLWSGLRIGWIRAPEPLMDGLVQLKAAHDLAASVPSQLLTADLLGAVTDGWLTKLRVALATRRDRLAEGVAACLPAWRMPHRPAAGLSMWFELPIADADAFAHVAARHGVTVAPGRAACGCGQHRHGLRLSYAEHLDLLDLGVDRLTAAWETHSEDLAATPGG